jgi:uncharacterized protein YkwD
MKSHNNKIKYIQTAAISIAILFSFTVKVLAADITIESVYYDLNKERTDRGLSSLSINPDLANAARLKSKDMINRHYFEHYAFGLTPWDFMKISGYNYLYAGENLAMDFATSEGMTKAWMNSPAHKENILNPDFKEVGIGVVKGTYTENGKAHETVMVTTMFGTQKPKILKVIDYLLGLIFPFR